MAFSPIPQGEKNPGQLPYLLTFLALATGILFAGYLYYIFQIRQVEYRYEEELLAVTSVRTSQVIQWKNERLADAAVIRSMSTITRSVHEFLLRPTAQRTGAIRDWLLSLNTSYDYITVTILDSTGSVRAHVGQWKMTLTGALDSLVEYASRSGTVLMSDIHSGTKDEPLHVDVIVPLAEPFSGHAFGFLILRADPAATLSSVVEFWPTPSQSMESLLLRSAAGRATIVSRPRFDVPPAAPEAGNQTVEQTILSAAAQGQEGIVSGLDYRGAKVFAALERVPGTTWMVMSKMDEGEVRGAGFREVPAVLTFVLLLLVAAGTSTIAIARRHQLGSLQRQSQAEHARHEAERSYQTLFSQMVAAVAIHDVVLSPENHPVDGRIQDVNPSFERLTGMQRADLIGRRIFDVFPSIDRTLVEGCAATAMTGQQARFEKSTQFAGREYDVTAYSPRSGQFAISFMDITDRRNAELRLMRLNRLYAMLSDINKAIVRMKAPLDIFPHVCRAAVEQGEFDGAWVGLIEEGGVAVRCVARFGKGGVESIPARMEPGDEGEDARTLWEALRSGASVIQCPVLPAGTQIDGRRHPDSRSAGGFFPLLLAGRPVGILGLHTTRYAFFDSQEVALLDELGADISLAMEVHEKERQRRHAEDALERNEERFRAVVNSMGDMVYTLDRGERYVALYGTWPERYGFTRDFFFGKTAIELFGEDEGAVHHEANLSALNGEHATYQWTMEREGETLTFLTEVSPLFDRAGNVGGVVGVGRDITSLTRTEEVRRGLEHRLSQSQKMESIGTLAGGVAHDFNNILGIILGHATVLERQLRTDNGSATNVQAIKTSVERGAALVRQILTFARKTEVRVEHLNLNDAVRELTGMLKETFPRTIDLKFALAPDPLWVEGDRTQVHQMLLNLSVNARDAMPSGGTLTFATGVQRARQRETSRRDVPLAEFVYVRVADTGSGMDDETKRRVFEPFFTTKEMGKGTGLGLSVVYGMVESHGGHIDVESAVGRGTTFTIRFPLPVGIVTPQVVSEQPKGTLRGGSETILVVEDEQFLRDLLKDLLAEKGYTVVLAADGEEGLRLFQADPSAIALVLTDIGLPRMDGVTLFHQLRASTPGVRVVFASGYMDPQQKETLLEAGGMGVIQKPYRFEDVLSTIRTALDNG